MLLLLLFPLLSRPKAACLAACRCCILCMCANSCILFCFPGLFIARLPRTTLLLTLPPPPPGL